MSENTRRSEDGFGGQYPKSDEDWAAQLYREHGWTPPWEVQHEDGKVVGPATRPDGDAAPRHEA